MSRGRSFSAHYLTKHTIVSVCVQRLDGRSFPVDEVLEVAPFSGPLHGRRSACTVSGSGGTRPSCTSSSGPRARRRLRPRSSCGRCWRGAPSSRAEIDVEQVEQERDYRIRFASKEKAGSHAVLRIHSVFSVSSTRFLFRARMAQPWFNR